MADSRTVFAVACGEYSDYRVIALFEDEATAQTWAEAMQADEDGWMRDARVERFDLFAAGFAPQKSSTHHKSADLWDNGIIKSEREWSVSSWAIEQPQMARVHTRYVRGPCHSGKGGRIDVCGPTAEGVGKVFSEKVAMWKAGVWGGPRHDELNEEDENA